MIKKLKNILHSKEHPHTVAHPGTDLPALDLFAFSRNINEKLSDSSPVNYIKRKIKSSKSWAKIPRQVKLFHEECAYDSVELPVESANHEFENYTRMFNNTNAISSIDYGFDLPSQINLNSPLSEKIDERHQAKHSTLDTKVKMNLMKNYSNSCLMSTKLSEQSQYNTQHEAALDFKIIQRLKSASLQSPANIPILCVATFNFNSPKWLHLLQQFNLMCRHDIKLIDLNKGVPVNALFYNVEFDLIYVKTADEREGCVPRDSCKPITAGLVEQNNCQQMSYESNTNCSSCINDNTNDKSSEDSIKYHSLSIEMDYDNLEEVTEHHYTNVATFQPPGGNQSDNCESQSVKHFNSDTQYTRDSGYRSDAENLTHVSNQQLVNDYELTGESPQSINKCLESMQSRSRKPISISSNLNLTVMNDYNDFENNYEMPKVFNNMTYKSPASASSSHRHSTRHISSNLTFKNNQFERNKIRRSLDSNLTSNNYNTNKFHAVDIDINEEAPNYFKTLDLFKKKESQPLFPDLDVNKIELDSIREAREGVDTQSFKRNSSTVKKLWTVILKHEAKTPQEISVTPGMTVFVIRQYKSWLYIKLFEIEFFKSNQQQYGYIPRSCAVDMQDIIQKSSQNELVNLRTQFKNRKSQITAL